MVENYISAHGLFSDVWAAWTELALNLTVTLCLAPFLGIVGILLGKVVSVFFIAVFWKPYFLFSRGLKKSVAVYWRGMAPYYIIFAFYTLMTLAVYYYVIVPEVTTLPRLLLYGAAVYPLLMVCFFLTLFYSTGGMKYLVARQPKIYRRLYRS